MRFLAPLLLLTTSLCAHPDVRKYESYLNGLKTLSGTFTQNAPGGTPLTGDIQIWRPGRMRLDYHAPAKLLIVADGTWVMTYDKDLEERNYVSLDNTPAAFILKDNIAFNDKSVGLTSVVEGDNQTEISLIRKEDPDSGALTLVFQETPLALKEWSVIDPQGLETRVTLQGIKENISLKPGLFIFRTPNVAEQVF